MNQFDTISRSSSSHHTKTHGSNLGIQPEKQFKQSTLSSADKSRNKLSMEEHVLSIFWILTSFCHSPTFVTSYLYDFPDTLLGAQQLPSRSVSQTS